MEGLHYDTGHRTGVDKGVLVEVTGRKSQAWNDFKIWSKCTTHANCNHCNNDVCIGNYNSI